jgi:hypothetical protein
MKEKVRFLRIRVSGEARNYVHVPLPGCVFVEDGVKIAWIDIIGDALVITTEEEYPFLGNRLKSKVKRCPTCGQHIEESEEECKI